MAEKGWQPAFDDPIPLPRGRQLVTLRDARLSDFYIPWLSNNTGEAVGALDGLVDLPDHRIARVYRGSFMFLDRDHAAR
jgi:hypothetical protein